MNYISAIYIAIINFILILFCGFINLKKILSVFTPDIKTLVKFGITDNGVFMKETDKCKMNTHFHKDRNIFQKEKVFLLSPFCDVHI